MAHIAQKVLIDLQGACLLGPSTVIAREFPGQNYKSAAHGALFFALMIHDSLLHLSWPGCSSSLLSTLIDLLQFMYVFKKKWLNMACRQDSKHKEQVAKNKTCCSHPVLGSADVKRCCYAEYGMLLHETLRREPGK